MRRYKFFLEPGTEDALGNTIKDSRGRSCESPVFSIRPVYQSGTDKDGFVQRAYKGISLDHAKTLFISELNTGLADACTHYAEEQKGDTVVIRGKPVKVTYMHKVRDIIMIRTVHGIVFVGEDGGYSRIMLQSKFETRTRRLVNAQRFNLTGNEVSIEDAVVLGYSPDEPISGRNVGIVIPEVRVFNNNSVGEKHLNPLLTGRKKNFVEDEDLEVPEEKTTDGNLCIYELPHHALLIGTRRGHNPEDTRILIEESLELPVTTIRAEPSLYAAALQIYHGREGSERTRFDFDLNPFRAISEAPAEGILSKL